MKRYKNWLVLFTLKSDNEFADAHEIYLDINNMCDAVKQLTEKYGDDLDSVSIGRNFSDID